jgi:transcriptional regulator with GAF, ATPase, and Fis domain
MTSSFASQTQETTALYVYFNNACLQTFEVKPGRWYVGTDKRGSLALAVAREDLAFPMARLEMLRDYDTSLRALSPDIRLYVNNRLLRETPLSKGDEILIEGHLMIWGHRKDLKDFVLANEADIPALIVEDGPNHRIEIEAVLPQSAWTPLAPSEGDAADAKNGHYSFVKAQRQMSSLLLLSQEINTIVELEPLLEKCLEYIFAILMVDRAAILLSDDTGKLDVSRVAYRRGKIPETIRIPESITQQAMERQAGLLVRNPLDDPRFQTKPSVVEASIQSAMAVPLAKDNDFLGLLYTDTSNPAVQFSVEDLRFLAILANLTTVAIVNSRRVVTLVRRNQALEANLTHPDFVGGRSSGSIELFKMLDRVADSSVTVLLTGESGCGKEVAARYLHESSGRRDKPFVAVNCAAVPDNLIESELFGHEKGAFTGADASKPGKFELADTGTLLLDEIGEIPAGFQAKLLRVLEGYGFERVGGTRTLKPRVRIITATNRNLREAVMAGRFREDLFYRLSVFPIHVAPLRERREDILPLAQFYIARFARDLSRDTPELSEGAERLLVDYHWPGNIRELRNLIERAVILCDGDLIPADLVADSMHSDHFHPPSTADIDTLVGEGIPRVRHSGAPDSTPLPTSLWDQEVETIKRALQLAEGNRSKAARMLGISRHHLVYRIKKYGIEV